MGRTAKMKSAFLTLLRDEATSDSVENALVITVVGLVVFSSVKTVTTGRNTAFTAVVFAPQASLSGVVDAILKIGEERGLLLRKLRLALVSGKDDEALRLARELCGLGNGNEKGY